MKRTIDRPQAGLPDNSLLDVVDGGELADGGLGSVVGAVINSDLAALDLALDFLVLVGGEGLEVPAVCIGGQADIIAVLQTEVAIGTCDVAQLPASISARAVLTASDRPFIAEVMNGL